MNILEVRIQATNTFPHRGEHDESNSYYLENLSPANAAGILGGLRKQSALEHYITENSIPANSKPMPQLFSSLNDQGEFSVSLPSTVAGTQFFVIRIIR